MTIYIVMSHDYEISSIVRAFTTLGAAEAWALRLNSNDPDLYYDVRACDLEGE